MLSLGAMIDESKRYRLDITVWRWTNSSRDSEHPRFFDTIKECYDEVHASRRFLQKFDYGIWCAEIRDTQDGDKLVGFVPTDPEPSHVAVRPLGN